MVVFTTIQRVGKYNELTFNMQMLLTKLQMKAVVKRNLQAVWQT